MKLQANVREIMKKNVVTVTPNMSIRKIARIMKNKRIGSVIVKQQRDIIGIVTTSDIVYKYVAMKKGRYAKDIMTKKLIKISPNKTIEHAAKLMAKKNIEKLLVFEKGKMIGIITSNDILRVEPTLIEILLERMKVGGKREEIEPEFGECENCGNFSDDLEEVNGMWLCEECREEL